MYMPKKKSTQGHFLLTVVVVTIFTKMYVADPFAFVTLNIAVENIQHASHRPSIRTQHPKNVPLNITKAKGDPYIPKIAHCVAMCL